MGYTTSYDTLDQTRDLASAVSIHFSTNCFPTVPQYMVPVAVEAIECVAYDDDYALLDLPEGVTFRNERQVRASSVVDTLHLHAFVDWIVDQKNFQEESETV